MHMKYVLEVSPYDGEHDNTVVLSRGCQVLKDNGYEIEAVMRLVMDGTMQLVMKNPNQPNATEFADGLIAYGFRKATFDTKGTLWIRPSTDLSEAICITFHSPYHVTLHIEKYGEGVLKGEEYNEYRAEMSYAEPWEKTTR